MTYHQGDIVYWKSIRCKIIGEYNRDPSKPQWLLLQNTSDPQQEYSVPPEDVRPETFFEFCTRRTGFGKTKWAQFGLIQLMVGMCVLAGLLTWYDSGWVGIVAGAAIEVVLVWGTWMNYTRKAV